jgi:outer membrane receptor protein involved in Fe transport
MRVSALQTGSAHWHRFLRTLLILCSVTGLGIRAGETETAKRTFNIAAGPAETALRTFAIQSQRELLYSTHVAHAVRTNAVQGEFTAEEALDRLLAGTVLVLSRMDGVLRITRDPAPRASRTATRVRQFFARPAPPSTEIEENLTITLSPFEVQTGRDTGYVATNTLAGSRLNTALSDTPASISVFTREFIEDIGATNVTEALEYSLNGAQDLTDATGNLITTNDLLLQFRGFTGASLGRNYFAWSLSSDSYNLERLDFSRGPNSILFGIGGPGGVLNASTKRAQIGADTHEVRFRIARFDDRRAHLDTSTTLVPGILAARVNLVYQDKKDWREFVGAERKGAALATTWRPLRNTVIRFDGEYGDVNQVVAQPWPAQERYQKWIDAGSVIAVRFGEPVSGTGANNSRQFVYDPESKLGPISWFGSRVSSAGPTAPSLGNNTAAVTDERILPRTSAVTGPGFRGDHYFYNYAVFIEQRVGSFALEAAFNRQSEQREQYRPQVFNDVALRFDVNAVLPNGEPNPNVGRLYTDGQLQVDYRDQVRDDYRLTGSYELDLRPHHRWLGKHIFSGLLARRDAWNRNDGLNEVNITPDVSASFPLDLTDPANLIRRRTYLDFSSSTASIRGLHDPRLHPISSHGVRSGLARIRDASTNELTRIDSKMAALQSTFLQGRFVFTGGLRVDHQRAWGSTSDLNGNGTSSDDRDPVTRTFPIRQRNARPTYAHGTTRTYGAVLHPTSWLSLFYNNANNFIPQAAERDIFGRPLGNRLGRGEDAGIRLQLLEGRITPSLVYYRTEEVNTAVGRDNAFINAIDTIWQTLGSTNRVAALASRDSQDNRGKGWEFELTANPTAQWRLSANLSRTDQRRANIQPRDGAYIEANRALWNHSGDLPAIILAAAIPPFDSQTGQPATIRTALRTVDQLYAGFRQAEGQSRRQLRKYQGNLFGSYDFAANAGWVSRWRVGGGLNYRGKAVVGYDTTRSNAPLYGSDYLLLNVMLARSFKLSSTLRLRVQLNVDNVLDESDPIIADANQDRVYRIILKAPRRWSLTTGISF